MITVNELVEIGKFNKPHGIAGEVNATIDRDVDVSSLKCIVLDVDGIYVPFFIESFRSKGVDSCLLTIDGICSEDDASRLSKKTIYALKKDCALPDDDGSDDDGMYAEDFIGYTISDTGGNVIGKIEDVDDSTDNVLFIVRTDEKNVYIPVADEFIVRIDSDALMVAMELPSGLIDL